jgi:hypothetical protein
VSVGDADDPFSALQCDAAVTNPNMEILSADCSNVEVRACTPPSPPGCYEVVYFTVRDPFGAQATCQFVVWGDY